MEVKNVPVLGRIDKMLFKIMLNLILLGVMCFLLGLTVLFYPPALAVLASLFLVIASFSLINIAYSVHSYRKKYLKLFD